MEECGGRGEVLLLHQSVELPVLAEEGEPVGDGDGGAEGVEEVGGGEGARGGVLQEEAVRQEGREPDQVGTW